MFVGPPARRLSTEGDRAGEGLGGEGRGARSYGCGVDRRVIKMFKIADPHRQCYNGNKLMKISKHHPRWP